MSTATRIADILESLTPMQRMYVQARLKGLSKVAAATAAGGVNPKRNAHKFEESENVRAALRTSRELFAQEVAFDRKKAHDMYMDAYHAADTATEMKLCVDSLVKLHGIAAVEVKRLQHEHSGSVDHTGQVQITHLSDSKLIEMARLTPEQDPNIIEGEIVRPLLEHDGGDA